MGDLHVPDFESFLGHLWPAGSHTFGLGCTVMCLLDSLVLQMFVKFLFGTN